MLTGGNQGLL